MATDVEFKKLKKVLEFVWNSPHSDFYRNKYKAARVDLEKDINSWKDFEKLPFLEKDELLAVDPSKRQYMNKSRVNHVLVSSGTTKTPRPLLLLTTTEIYNLQPAKKELLKKIKTPLLLFPPLQMANPVALFQALRPYEKMPFLVFGDINNLDLSAQIASTSEIDAILTSPTGLLTFIPHLEKYYDLKKIKLVRLQGEYCSEEKAKFFKSKFKGAYIEFLFGSTEALTFGIRCQYLLNKPPRFFHPVPFFHYEIVKQNDDSQLALTSLTDKRPFPLIRYLTGDVVAIKKVKCRCGENTQFEVFGRMGNEVAKLSGVTLYAYLVEQALVPFSGLIETGKFQIHLYEERLDDKIVNRLKINLIPLESRPELSLKKTLEEGIPDYLYLSSKKTLADLIKTGAFLPLEIEFVKNFDSLYKHKHIISHII